MPEQPQAETWPYPIEAFLQTDVSMALRTRAQGLTLAEAARLLGYGHNTIRPVATTPLVCCSGQLLLARPDLVLTIKG